MKAKRLLFLVIAICLASGVRAQFYDGPDDIYFYVTYKNGEIDKTGWAFVFNFDGKRACCWPGSIGYIQEKLKNNPNYFEEGIETKEYKLKYISNNTYEGNLYGAIYDPSKYNYDRFIFSYDRQKLTYITHRKRPVMNNFGMPTGFDKWVDEEYELKRVSRDVLKPNIGRSRKPSGTIYE